MDDGNVNVIVSRPKGWAFSFSVLPQGKGVDNDIISGQKTRTGNHPVVLAFDPDVEYQSLIPGRVD